MKASLVLRAVASDDLAIAPETKRMGHQRKALRRAQNIKAKAWVARLTPHLGALRREFLRGSLDYRRDEGAYVTYVLNTGVIYEVSSPTSPYQAERYFARVTDDGDIMRVSQEDVNAWLALKTGDNPSA